ncbi:hypothetical protein HC823_00320 [Candidatus Gracilibacteria bacterium]|nr:hypothetical protein [Candidatus Gracilibacteria bacterium]
MQYFADSSLRKFEARTDFSIPLREDFDPFEFDALKNELKKYDIKWEVLSAAEMGEFSLPPRMHVQFQDITQVGDVFETFKNSRYTEVVGAWDGKGEQEFVRLVERLLALRNSVEGAAKFLVLVFLGGGILLMINTFRLVIFSRRNEIFIARLVGADPGFVTGPFLMEGALLGFFSSFLAIILFTFILREVEMLPSGEIFLHLWNNIFLWELLLSGGVGVLGAWIATRKYLFGKFEE